MRQRLICGQPGAPTKGFLPDWRLPAVRRTPICRDGKWPVPKKSGDDGGDDGPQTQGKVERYHLTLKKWLRKKPACATLAELQDQIDRFVHIYNEERPHTARGCPPMQAWRALDKAVIVVDGQPMPPHTKVRRDRIDASGCFTLRYRSKLHHVGVGRVHRGRRVLILVADLDVRVIGDDGVMLRHLELDPSVDYQRQNRDTV